MNLKPDYIIKFRACRFQNKFSNTANIFYARLKKILFVSKTLGICNWRYLSLVPFFSWHSQNEIVPRKQLTVEIANLENGARLTVPRNQIVLVDRELTENVIKKKIDDVQFPDQGLVPDRQESKSKLRLTFEHAKIDI